MPPTASAVVGDVLEAARAPEANAYTKNWYKSDARVTAEFGDIKTNIIVRAKAGSKENLTDIFSSYNTNVIWDGNDCSAIVVYDILHKDIDKLVNAVGGNWLHYME